jgi:GntR family transcriptional regulator
MSQLDAAGPPIERLNIRSVPERTREALLAAIRSESFPEGRLPPEEDMAVLLGVSRTTLRAALQSLQDDGLISRRRGRGTFVNRHLLRASMRLNRLVPFTELIEQCGHTASVDRQTAAEVVIGGRGSETVGVDAAAALALQEGDRCLVVDRLLRANGAPVIAIVDVVPLARLSVDPSAVAHADSTFELLGEITAAPVEYATSEIVPRVAGEREPRGLGLAPGTGYIELLETLYSREHERLAVSRVSVDDSLVRFSLLRREG